MIVRQKYILPNLMVCFLFSEMTTINQVSDYISLIKEMEPTDHKLEFFNCLTEMDDISNMKLDIFRKSTHFERSLNDRLADGCSTRVSAVKNLFNSCNFTTEKNIRLSYIQLCIITGITIT